jgi:hypothetical protein
MAGVLKSLKSYSRINLKPMDLQDAFPSDMEALIASEKTRNFRAFSSVDDYNREISSIFRDHGAAFYIDRSHNDGHFRV